MTTRRIPVTIGFDQTRPIGVLTIDDTIDIPHDAIFALAYVVKEWKNGKLERIHVTEVIMVSDEEYMLNRQKDSENVTQVVGASTIVLQAKQHEEDPWQTVDSIQVEGQRKFTPPLEWINYDAPFKRLNVAKTCTPNDIAITRLE